MISQPILAIKQRLTPEDEIVWVTTREFPAYFTWVLEMLPGGRWINSGRDSGVGDVASFTTDSELR
jgi:hypothetical protein